MLREEDSQSGVQLLDFGAGEDEFDIPLWLVDGVQAERDTGLSAGGVVRALRSPSRGCMHSGV